MTVTVTVVALEQEVTAGGVVLVELLCPNELVAVVTDVVIAGVVLTKRTAGTVELVEDWVALEDVLVVLAEDLEVLVEDLELVVEDLELVEDLEVLVEDWVVLVVV